MISAQTLEGKKARKLLKREIAEGEMLINRSIEKPGSAGGRPRDVYMISLNQFGADNCCPDTLARTAASKSIVFSPGSHYPRAQC